MTPIRNNFDVILIDCQPSLGLFTVDALAVADYLIIPVACEYLAQKGSTRTAETVRKIQIHHNNQLKIAGLLPTMFDRRTNHTAQVLKELYETFEPEIRVYEYTVYRSIRFAESAAAGEPTIHYARSYSGRRRLPASWPGRFSSTFPPCKLKSPLPNLPPCIRGLARLGPPPMVMTEYR